MPPDAVGDMESYHRELQESSAAAKHFGVKIGQCSLCGTSLIHNYLCEDSSGTRFVVGCDCIEKLSENDLKIQIKRANTEKKRVSRYNDPKAVLEREAEAALVQQMIARRVLVEKINAKLIRELNGKGNFGTAMAKELKSTPFGRLTPRQKEVIAKIIKRSLAELESELQIPA